MTSYAITVVGHDRPGIVAEVTGALAEHGGNLEDSSMSLLRGHFAWTLIVAVDASVAELESTVEPLRRPDLAITVLPVPEEELSATVPTAPFWLTVHGGDRPGIVSAITHVLAEVGANLTNLTTRLAGDLYIVGADVDVPVGVHLGELHERLRVASDSLGVTAKLRPADDDVL